MFLAISTASNPLSPPTLTVLVHSLVPLTRLTSIPFKWSSEADDVFSKLKSLFISAPVLCHPDPSGQFIVEVDTSDSGVGAVLSLRSLKDQRLHPCAFFSRRLSPAGVTYDIGNRKLLAVVLALQEWRHWLEGSEQPLHCVDKIRIISESCIISPLGEEVEFPAG